MAISVAVPKNLSGIKTKVALNLTKRQIICFSSAALVAAPTYFLSRRPMGTQGAALLLILVALPFFFFAMYEKDGFPAEKIFYFMIRQRILTPGIRRYHSQDIYTQMELAEIRRKEAEQLEHEKEARSKELKGRLKGKTGRKN